MRALWFGFALVCCLVLDAVPVWADDADDFSRQARYHFAKQYYRLEREKVPVVREPAHAVRSGQVSMMGAPLDPVMLAKPVATVAPLDVSQFGQPRLPQAVVMRTPPPSPAVPAPSVPMKLSKDEHAVKPVKSSARHVAGRVATHVVATQAAPISYPRNVGYSFGGSDVERSSASYPGIRINSIDMMYPTST